MKMSLILGIVVLMVSGCSVMRHIGGTDQCMAPTPQEAKITSKVWK